ncbi:hypothetical protein WJX81_006563 [Elliptochloris bilobata]|uniref:Uncharacterized protein n=1 Tax=Elliptochloris bilobata TaxID=381761 RepID=A0AAW1QTJ3_9CHLO
MRLLEAQVDVGRVLFVEEGNAIIEGLNNDAPVGCALAFVSGATGALLWRRSDNICFALLLGGGGAVEVGEGVECKVKAILQVVDEQQGPRTRKEYTIARVPVGAGGAGQVVDFLIRPLDAKLGVAPPNAANLGAVTAPMLGVAPDMDAREQICEALTTGVKAVDALTPLGRGQALLVTGARGSGKSALVLDAVLAQARSNVQCIYAAVGQSTPETEAAVATLRRGGAMAHTTVVAASAGAPLGERFAALSAAAALGERVRDVGGHALVVLDDISCMVEMWERITAALATLGPTALALGEDSLTGAAASELQPEQLVEYEGMLVSANAAQRRRFFGSMLQRAAKLHRRKGGGSLTMLLVLPGLPARGEPTGARARVLAQDPDAKPYSHLSDAQRAKLAAALSMRAAAGTAAPGDDAQPAGCVRMEVVEEVMSIADGQVVLVPGPGGLPVVDPAASISRIGGRAYPPALATLAPQLRFELAQAADALRFASDPDSPAVRRQAEFVETAWAALAQEPGQPVPLEEQAALLFALQTGLLQGASAASVRQRLTMYLQALRCAHPGVLRNIAASQALPPGAAEVMRGTLEAACAAFNGPLPQSFFGSD